MCRFEISRNDEGRKLLAIVRRGSGSVVRWRRAQIVLWSAQRMDVPAIAKIAFTSEDRVRAVIHNFNEDGFDSLAPKYAGGRPPTFTLPQRREIKKIALSRPPDHGLPFSTWSLSKLAEFLVAEGVVDDISHEGLRVLLREEGVSFQVIKTFKASNDPDFEAKKNRVLELYDIADGKAEPGPEDPTVVICMDEFGPLNLQPHPGKQWAAVAAANMPNRACSTATAARPPTRAPTVSAICSPATTCRPIGSTAHVKVRKGPDRVPRVLPLPAFAVPARGAYRDRVGQLQPAPVNEEGPACRRLGGGQQRRARLRAVLRVVAQPDRGPVHRAALLRARRHRPPHPPSPGQDDPPLHRLAEPQRPRPGTT